MKLSVFDRIVTIVPGVDKHTSVEDVFEHVINGVRVLFHRQTQAEPEVPAPVSDKTQLPTS